MKKPKEQMWIKSEENGIVFYRYSGKVYGYAYHKELKRLLLESGKIRITLNVRDFTTAKQIVKSLELI